MVQIRSLGRTRRPRSVGNGPGEMAREVAGLATLNAKALKEKWLTLCGAAPPPGLSRPWMIRALAYHIQEQALGGLKPATRRFLRQFAADADAGQTSPARPSRTVQPDTVLVREWHGTSHRVTVLETGCSWRGRRYRSLSEVARAITGTRWSGPRFFGLGRAQEERRNGTHHA